MPTRPPDWPTSTAPPPQDEADTGTDCYVGIDLAWFNGRTGLATVDASGRLIRSTSVHSDEQIDAWLANLPTGPAVIAVDAPLVVPNPTGQRPAERAIGRAYGWFGASAHTASQSTFGGHIPRATALAERHRWAVNPATQPEQGSVCIEVYPHTALIGLFRLGYRVAYKKGRKDQRIAGFRELSGCLESIEELRLQGHPRWAALQERIASPSHRDLDEAEDEIDAILCAHLAWLWRHRPTELAVYGDASSGYIVAPPPPDHPSRRPNRPKV